MGCYVESTGKWLLTLCRSVQHPRSGPVVLDCLVQKMETRRFSDVYYPRKQGLKRHKIIVMEWNCNLMFFICGEEK